MTARLFLIVLAFGNFQCLFAASIQIPPRITAYLRNGNNSVTEDGLLPFNNPETAAFADYVLHNWRDLLANFDQIAPDAREQCLIVASAEPLSPSDYLHFVNGLCDLRLAGGATPQAIWTVLWASMNKNGFLAYNYDQPDVSAVIDKLQVIMLKENPKQWTEFFKEMKSGQMKQNVIQRIKRDGDSMPETFVKSKHEAFQANQVPSTAAQVPQNALATSGLPVASRSQGAVLSVAQKVAIWPWIIGIVALVGFAVLVLKLRR